MARLVRSPAYLLMAGVLLLLLLMSDSGQKWQQVVWLPSAVSLSQLERQSADNNASTALSWRQLVQTSGANRTSDTHLVFYNRVDKCGSETLNYLIKRQRLQKRNFKMLSSKSYWKRYLSRASQAALIQSLAKKSKKFPLIYNRHISYIDFTTFNTSQPIYVNLVRDPVERFISLFYFLRSSRRRRNRNATDTAWLQKNLTLCVLDNDPECAMSPDYRHPRPHYGAEFFQPMTSFFCGHEPMCRKFNSRPALQKALWNLENKYAVVGVLESFRRSLQTFETFVPMYFRNIVTVYDKQQRKRLNKNSVRSATSSAVKAALTSRLSADIELYMFAKQRLYLQYKRMGGFMRSENSGTVGQRVSSQGDGGFA